MKHNYKFSFGPWNVSNGADVAGPAVRPSWPLDWKLERLRAIGFEAMMLHDDDVVPEIDSKSDRQIRREARELKRRFDDAGVAIDLIAPRLWFDPRTIDGAFTSNDAKARRYAVDRAVRAAEIARLVGCPLVDLCLVRDGTYLREAKDGRRAIERLVHAINAILESDARIKVVIEPKPNEPVDTTYVPTPGHAIALSHLTADPKRVGVLIESSHCVLAGLDPADEMDFALAADRLWCVHLNDQNGLKFEQDRPFGSTSLRSAFNQVRILERNGYGRRGEAIAFEVYPFRTTKPEHVMDHLANSRRTFLRLLEKVRTFNEKRARELVSARNYQELDQMVIEHLMGK
ncbi:MAG TPA: TIM barrel protein [Terrimicrobiaceae bacterium]|nr:TIM barrel protein [Terrimicrobiaceae bacterium]